MINLDKTNGTVNANEAGTWKDLSSELDKRALEERQCRTEEVKNHFRDMLFGYKVDENGDPVITDHYKVIPSNFPDEDGKEFFAILKDGKFYCKLYKAD